MPWSFAVYLLVAAIDGRYWLYGGALRALLAHFNHLGV